MEERVFNFDGNHVKYVRKPGKYDTKHLVIVFSGFSGDGKPIYNYGNALVNCPADVLWIKDEFEGGESYYICSKGKMDIEASVYGLIMSVLHELNLSHEDCTLLGGSKGGSAALYYGLKYNFKNIIATVPQFRIGSYVEIDWLYAFKHMIGDLDLTSAKRLQAALDHLIVDQIHTASKDKNIYLISSHGDPQFETEVKDYVHVFSAFKNFNLIFADSDLIVKHNQVNRHIVSITMSIVSLTAMGLSPTFQSESVKYRNKNSEGEEYLKPVVLLRKLSLDNGRLYLEGDSYLTGIPCPNYHDIDFHLVLVSGKKIVSIDLAKGNKKSSINCYPFGTKISYSKGWFCTKGYAGLNVNDFPLGEWDVYIRINARGIIKERPLISNDILNVEANANKKSIIFSSDLYGAKLKVACE
ncbi:TPA: hypothetical protein R8G50_003422 [Citrobacter freundii]|uniref:accessory Sec system protein Asp2 n=1 Tax=Citrobacter freundii TaxID=546 RepID=UPI00295DB14E|nr:hypothetical protein [Citrobacter freundii]